MEHAVKPGALGADAVENGADCVGDATQKQEQEAGGADIQGGDAPEGEDGPAHADVANHGEHPELPQVDGGEGAGDGGQNPLQRQEAPAQGGISGQEGADENGGVGAGDEGIDGAVVNDLHDLFPHPRVKPVVHAGHGVKGDEGQTVNQHPQNGQGGGTGDGAHKPQHQRQHAEAAACDVGDHIHQLLSPGVVGKKPLGQGNAFCHRVTAFQDLEILYPIPGFFAPSRRLFPLSRRDRPLS